MAERFGFSNFSIEYGPQSSRVTRNIAGEIYITITGANILEFLAGKFTSAFSEAELQRLARRISQRLSMPLVSRRFDPIRTRQIGFDFTSLARNYISLLRAHQQKVNRLKLSREYAKRVNRKRFSVHRTFDELSDIILEEAEAAERPEVESQIFDFDIIQLESGSIEVRLDINVEALLDKLLERSDNPKKTMGLYLNILVGYQEFVTRVMSTNRQYYALATHKRRGLPQGYFPSPQRTREAIKDSVNPTLMRQIKRLYEERSRGNTLPEVERAILDDLMRMFNDG